MNEFDKTNQQDVAKGSKRRSFLKKSATGAVVFSLPAKSVWGVCSVSGTGSGNMSTHGDKHECTITTQGGLSPGFWKELLERDNLHAVFVNVATAKNTSKANKKNIAMLTAYENTNTCYRNAVADVMAHNMVLPSELNPLIMTVEAGLDSQGSTPNNIYFHMAAVYLNCYFGLYNNYVPGSDVLALQAIEEVFLFWYMGNNFSSQIPFHKDMLGYDLGATTTMWEPTSCI